jgi:hypothetical protein
MYSGKEEYWEVQGKHGGGKARQEQYVSCRRDCFWVPGYRGFQCLKVGMASGIHPDLRKSAHRRTREVFIKVIVVIKAYGH